VNPPEVRLEPDTEPVGLRRSGTLSCPSLTDFPAGVIRPLDRHLRSVGALTRPGSGGLSSLTDVSSFLAEVTGVARGSERAVLGLRSVNHQDPGASMFGRSIL
jgi:hypothetical protein